MNHSKAHAMSNLDRILHAANKIEDAVPTSVQVGGMTGVAGVGWLTGSNILFALTVTYAIFQIIVILPKVIATLSSWKNKWVNRNEPS